MNPNKPNPIDDDVWRSRFVTINLTRIGGTIVCLIGLYLWHDDFLRPGGAIEIGLPLALLGLAISFLVPQHLAHRWRTPDDQ